MSAQPSLLRQVGTTAAGLPYLIRPTREEDAAALVEIHDAVAAEERRLAAVPGDRSVMEQALTVAGIVGGGGVSLTLEVAGTIAGTVLVQRYQTQYHTHLGELAIVVARQYRSAGLGRRLMETAVAWARQVGITKLCLNVLPANWEAVELYRSLGFRSEGTRRNQVKLPDGYRDVMAMGLLLENGAPSPP